MTSQDPSKDNSYGDTSGKLWSVYLTEADKQDKALAENWKGDTDGILIFTGLFSATVATFIVESYKNLQPDSGDLTNAYLAQISQQLVALSNNTQYTPPPLPQFHTPGSAVRVNILWFLSLTLSITCALLATLMQQWARRYLQLAQGRSAPHKRARMRAYLFEGVATFRLAQAVEAVPALLHVAVFLFFAGLIEFLFTVNLTVAHVMLAVISVAAGAYLLLTVLPTIRPNCPYRTPFSWPPLKWVVIVVLWPFSLLVGCLQYCLAPARYNHIQERVGLLFAPMLRSPAEVVDAMQLDIDAKSLEWTLETVDDDDDLEAFVEGIPGFLRSDTVLEGRRLVTWLLNAPQAVPLRVRMSRLLQTCTPGTRGLTEHARRRRVLACINTVWYLTDFLQNEFHYHIFGPNTWDSLNLLKRDSDSVVALNAQSTAALAAHVWLNSVKRGLLLFAADLFATLVDPPRALQVLCLERDAATRNGFLVNIIGYVSGIIPFLRSSHVDEGSLSIVWETLPRLMVTMDPGEASQEVQEAFMDIWRELDNVLDELFPAANGNAVQMESHPLLRTLGEDFVQERYARLRELLLPIVHTLQPGTGYDHRQSFPN